MAVKAVTTMRCLGNWSINSLRNYRVMKANEMPAMDVIFIQTDEPSGPFGAKSVSEIAIDGVAPALVNAVHNATGVWFHTLPLTKERVIDSLHEKFINSK